MFVSCFNERATLLAVFVLIAFVLIALVLVAIVLVVLIALVLIVLTVVLHEGTSFQLVEYRRYCCLSNKKYTEKTLNYIVHNYLDWAFVL